MPVQIVYDNANPGMAFKCSKNFNELFIRKVMKKQRGYNNVEWMLLKIRIKNVFCFKLYVGYTDTMFFCEGNDIRIGINTGKANIRVGCF